jgi:hypothetical protein
MKDLASDLGRKHRVGKQNCLDFRESLAIEQGIRSKVYYGEGV